jgi:IS30 family transposase
MSKYHQLTQEERYRITAHRMAGNSQAQIARLL